MSASSADVNATIKTIIGATGRIAAFAAAADAAAAPLLVEEEGVSFFYYDDSSTAAADGENAGAIATRKPHYIGTKRYAGLYCRACERPLGFADDKPLKIARAMRKADKNDANIVAECAQCGACVGDKKPVIVPCCSFDWHMPPHIFERMLRTERAVVVPPKKKNQTSAADDDAEDGDENSNGDAAGGGANNGGDTSKAKQKRKEALSQIESEKPKAVRSAMSLPKLSRNGHIENQYGHAVSLQDFFAHVVEPCVVRCYDRVPKHWV